MTQKIIISKPGFDAGTTTIVDNLIFSSDYNTLKYDTSGTIVLSIIGNGSTQVTQSVIAHNLGYTPFFTCFVNSGGQYYFIPRNEQTAAPNSTVYANAYANGTNLYLTLNANPGNGTTKSVTYAYKIFKNNTLL